MKLNIGAFALAFGIWWGVGIFIATWWLIFAGVETTAPLFLEHFYIGYRATPLGSLFASCGSGRVAEDPLTDHSVSGTVQIESIS